MSSEEHLEGRRRAILTAAQQCFEANGYAATTVEAVADKAGISKGSIYNYFGSKQDLFAQLFASYCTTGKAEYERTASQATSAIEMLNHMLDWWSAMLGNNTRIGSLVLEYWGTAARQKERGEFSDWFSQMYNERSQKLAGIIAQGVEEGNFRKGFDPLVAARLILAMLDGITIQAVLDQSMKLDSDLLAAIKRAILTSLTTEPAQEKE